LDIGYRYELPQTAKMLVEKPGDAGVTGQALVQAVDGCTKALNFYEVGAAGVTTFSFLVALGGSIAGGIVAPTLTAAANANKAQIAAWSGVSGVSNSAQIGLSQVPMQALQIRESMRTGYLKAIDEFRGPAPRPIILRRETRTSAAQSLT
jgi:hypothetical protein